jgi:hypothetical protein
MANSLINGTGAAMVAPDTTPDPNEGKTPTWGYNAAGGQIFYLSPGESLPSGYADSPVPVGVAPAKDAPDPANVDPSSLSDEEMERLTTPEAEPKADDNNP